MAQLLPKTRKFIDAIHRRLIFIRAVENLAVAGGIGAVGGLLVLPLLWWRDESGLPALACIFLGLFCGFLRGIAHRPTRLEAAVEADRQLNLHDLLGTSLLICDSEKNNEPDWQMAVFTAAEDRVAKLRPSDVLTARIGLRTWGGAGVVTSLLLTLSILTSRPADLRAAVGADENTTPSRILVNEQKSLTGELIDGSSSSHSRSPEESALREDSHREFQQDQLDRENGNDNSAHDASHSQNGSGGAGGGLAISQGKSGDSRSMSPNVSESGKSPGGQNSGGDGKIDRSAILSATPTSGNVNDQPTSRPTSPWTPGSANHAQGTSDSGQGHVPDWASDLVKDYFQRD